MNYFNMKEVCDFDKCIMIKASFTQLEDSLGFRTS